MASARSTHDRAPTVALRFAGQPRPRRKVATSLEVPLTEHEERNFGDSAHKTRSLQSVRGHDAFVLHALHGDDTESGNDKLCGLLFFCGSLTDVGAERVTAIVPYLCYARNDRRTKSNDPIITRYVAAMFEAVGIDRVIVVEVHNAAAFENTFRCPTWHIESASFLAAHCAPLVRGQPVVAVSPDAGGAKRAEQFRQALEQMTKHDVGSAYIEKYRSGGMVSGTLLSGDVNGKVAVIVDDLISTGGTLVRAAEACRTAGATKVFAASAHGLFVDGAKELFATSAIDGIIVTNTVPAFRVAPDIAARRLSVLGTREAIARTVAACRDAG